MPFPSKPVDGPIEAGGCSPFQRAWSPHPFLRLVEVGLHRHVGLLLRRCSQRRPQPLTPCNLHLGTLLHFGFIYFQQRRLQMMQSSAGTTFFIPALCARHAVLCAGCGRTQWLCVRVRVSASDSWVLLQVRFRQTHTVECEPQRLPLLNYL